MLENIEQIVNRLKTETNGLTDIIYRQKKIHKKTIYIIYNEPLTSSDKISDFIMRSLNHIEQEKMQPSKMLAYIENNISNFKVKKISNYNQICFYLHRGFTILLIEGEKEALVLETKANIARGISPPETESTVRGAKDAFVEDYQINLGLIKKRIKTNDLWIENFTIGKYTATQVGVLSIHGVVKEELVNQVVEQLQKIDIYGIIDSGMIKNLIEKETKSIFPTIITTERPDIVSKALLEGKVAIVVDNSPYILIVPGVLNDYFKTMEDVYGKGMNITFTRIIKFLAFIIALFTPAVYIALITYNQEMIPTDLLADFATQRDGVPFPAFFEGVIMIISFEILRESDLRVPSFSGSALSIVGALILGDAAVSAGIVSPIMIIVIAITAISSLPFTEYELENALRWYRLLFMMGASFLGIVGVLAMTIFFIVRLSHLESFGKPYLMPFAPTILDSLKNSIVKFPLKSLNKRQPYLSDNRIKQRRKNS